MATSENHPRDEEPERRSVVGFSCKGQCSVKEASTQTNAKVQGHAPRISKVNLFTLLSLWMELFPKPLSPVKRGTKQTRPAGLVVVRDRNVTGLHCSSADLHAGQIAVIRQGPRLKGCDLYFSRKPCSTCLKMIINAGVNRISYWPGDPEMSLLAGYEDVGSHYKPGSISLAVLDAAAAERLKSNSRPHICILLQPLVTNMQQYVEETSRSCEFLRKVAKDDPGLDVAKLFNEQQRQTLDEFTRAFFLHDQGQHRYILNKMGLENFCMEPYFSNLRHNMKDLIAVLASVTSSLPDLQHRYGFYSNSLMEVKRPLSQEVANHCIIQAQLLSYRTDDPKVGVGAVIWAERKSENHDGVGHMYLVGCGYNAYPVGSEYAEFPQMDDEQQDPQSRKYRYIIHAEQNALTFRSMEVKDDENTMMFVTKCPCDECVPLIRGAGIKQIYTTDLDSGRVKNDISYLMFEHLQGVQKFVWQRNSQVCREGVNSLSNGCLGKHERPQEEDEQPSKRQCS